MNVIRRPERRGELVPLLAAASAVIVGLGGILLGVSLALTPAAVGTTPMPAGNVSPAAGHPAAKPAALEIPVLGLTSGKLVELGHTADGRREMPGTAAGVGWFADGPAPGDAGVAVMAGNAGFGYAHGAFGRLAILLPGDEITVRDDTGQASRFVVRRVADFPADAPDSALVAPDSGGPELRLITCHGTYDTASAGHRTAVFAAPAP
ncbi:class F sortase [Amycolatopsis sp. NPDC059027]|uniref:class F sortase n=1 Tax=Amycolatopsis sp. NPDC059027 TaxID=3346709 RepID=UPI00366BC2D8